MEKKVGVNQPKRLEKARILIANTAMDTDKVKVFGSKVRVDSTAKIAELELAEKVRIWFWNGNLQFLMFWNGNVQFLIHCAALFNRWRVLFLLFVFVASSRHRRR